MCWDELIIALVTQTRRYFMFLMSWSQEFILQVRCWEVFSCYWNYSADFSNGDRVILRIQFETYLLHFKNHIAFSYYKDVKILGANGWNREALVFPLVYKLVELALLLPVSTSSIEGAFSTMKIIKSKLCNKINDDWFNHLMICYTEQDIFKSLGYVVTRGVLRSNY